MSAVEIISWETIILPHLYSSLSCIGAGVRGDVFFNVSSFHIMMNIITRVSRYAFTLDEGWES